MVTLLTVSVAAVIVVDPFFHYHVPIKGLVYTIDNQRSQNDGIIKNFKYDAMITGTSMIENFRTTELDSLFGTNSIKVPYSGGRFKEVDEAIKTAIKHKKELKVVVRGLDCGMLDTDPNEKREDLGEYPTYLYDDNVFNDYKYIFSSSILFDRIVKILYRSIKEEGSTTTFDDYSSWRDITQYGINSVLEDGYVPSTSFREDQYVMKEEERNRIIANITQNVTNTIKNNPDITFYYFFTPYSALWWRAQIISKTFSYQLETEKIAIEEMLKYENVKVFSYNDMFDVTINLNFYKDSMHYGDWINSFILKSMKNETHMLTLDNYLDYLNRIDTFYRSFGFADMNAFEDYEDDNQAAILLQELIDEGKI